MFGIGLPELIVILFVLCPVVALFVFISKAERRIEKDWGTVIQQIDDIVQQLRKRDETA